MKKVLNLFILGFSIIALASCDSSKTADKVIYGNIYTANEKDEVVDAIAIKDEKIIYVGNKAGAERYINGNTTIESYDKEKLITPSLVDGHTHVTQILVAQADEAGTIPSGASKQQCIDSIEDFVKKHQSKEFYTFTGWEMQNFSSEEYGCPTAEMIDYITTKPILAYSSDGHTFWVNTPMMNMAGITKESVSPVGGEIVKDNDGNPLGVFKDQAQSLIEPFKPDNSQQAYDKGIKSTDEMWLSQGYATRFNALGNIKSAPNRYPLINQLEEKDKKGELNTYVQSSFVIYDTKDALDLVDTAIKLKKDTKGGNHEVTNVKLFLDGIIENAGAYLCEPYEKNGIGKENYYGTPIWPGREAIERMSQIIAKANNAGMPCHFHCMGDQATSDALTAIELAAKQIGKDKVRNSRNAIAHLALVQKDDFARFNDLNVIAVLNPWMNKDPGYFNGLQIPLLGETRANEQYPAKSFLNNNINISFGTDMGASFTFNSIECFHALTTRKYKDDDPDSLLCGEEKLSRMEALKAMTIGGAYQLHKENEFGSIETGKDASFCVFSNNLLTIDESQIMSSSVEKTMVKGKWYSFDK